MSTGNDCPIANRVGQTPIRRRLCYDSLPRDKGKREEISEEYSRTAHTGLTNRNLGENDGVSRRYEERRLQTYKPHVTHDNRLYGRKSRDNRIAPLSKTQRH